MEPNNDQSSSPEPAPATRANPLDRLRGHRVRSDRARHISDDVLGAMRSMQKISENESAACAAWMTVVPDQIHDCSRVAGFKAGKLVVLVPSAARRHVVDRWLKSGGFRAFQSLSRVPIQGVTLTIDAPVND